MDRLAAAGASPPQPCHSTLGAWLILSVMIAVELYTQFGARDPGAWQQFRFRMMNDYGFLDRKFDAWLAGGSFTGVPRMFVSYLFVHDGPIHLAVNGALFLFVGPFLCRYIGPIQLLLLMIACGIGGALAFGLANDTSGPLVGASAACIGMLWAVKFWEFRWIRASGDRWGRYLLSILLLIGLKAMLYWATQGGIATEAHVGGAVAGILVAPLLSRDPPHGRFYL